MVLPASVTSSSLSSTFTKNLLRKSLQSKIHHIVLKEDSGHFQESNEEHHMNQHMDEEEHSPEQNANDNAPQQQQEATKEDIMQFIQQLPQQEDMGIKTNLFNQSYFVSEQLHGKYERVTLDLDLVSQHEQALKSNRFQEEKAYFTAKESVTGKELIDEERLKAIQEKKPKKLELWGGMTAKKLTPELKLQLKAFELAHAAKGGSQALQKKLKSKDLPRYFQFGTMVDRPEDYYQRRGKKRKATLLDSMVEEQQESGYVKQRFKDIQYEKHKNNRRKFKKAKR